MEEQEEKKGGVPKGLPISAAILLILGLVAIPLVENNFTEEELARNVIVAAIPFILIFAAIIVAFMSLVWFINSRLSNNISEKVYRPVEYVLMVGIVLGIVGMFQPWAFILYRIGFWMLFISTIGYLVWSHVRPASAVQRTVGSVSLTEFENIHGD